MTPLALGPSTLSAAIRIIREVLLFEKFCVKTDIYWTSDNTSRITMAHISLLYNYNKEVVLSCKDRAIHLRN